MMVQPPRFRSRPDVTTVVSAESREQEEDTQSRGSQSRRSSSSSKQQGDFGVEMVLSATTTTDTQRAEDMILPGSRTDNRESSPYQYVSTLRKDSDRSATSSSSSKDSKHRKSSNNSAASSSNKTRGLRQHLRSGSSVSVESSNNSRRQRAESSTVELKQLDSRSLIDDVSESSSASSAVIKSLQQQDDTIWKAAKRGDLAALKRFHSRGGVNWGAKDQYNNIPLYYACHSGAIVDINVVHFLLWVTPIKGVKDLEDCKNKKNKTVMKILDDFERKGFKTPMQFESKAERIPQISVENESKQLRKNSTPDVPQKKAEKQHSKPPRHHSASTFERATYNETATTSPRSGKKDKPKDVVQDSMLQSIIEDVNKIQVTPSNVTNIDMDEWSLGSMFSFGKKLNRRNSSRDRSLFNDETSTTSSRTGSIKPKDFLLRRKVSFDNMPAKKVPSSHYGYRQSPQYKVSHHTDSHEEGIHPRIDYDEVNRLWMIENHFAMEDATTSTVVLTIHVFDPSQKVIVRNCHGVSVDIHGKTMMSLSVEDCSDLNLVFNSAAHACNIVHCKNVAAETTGVCPKFSMDRVKGITVWLSRQSRDISNIVTSKCTEVSVLIPSGESDNDYERQELALPEKYVHHFAGGRVKSRVSSTA